MKKNLDESGFALIVLLTFISILSEIIISMMTSTLFAAKTTENFAAHSRYIHITNIALEQAKKDILAGNAVCFEHGCVIQNAFLKNREKLVYTIKFLETVPCFKIKGSEKPGADFFKIVVKIGNNIDAMNIQSTFTTSARSPPPCHQLFKTVEPGFLSWRVVE